MNTTQITLRGVDQELNKLITKNARQKGTSKNAYVLGLLRRDLGLTADSHDLWEKFAGSMPGNAISQEVLDDFEKIDESMWK